ncbi:MAG: Rrf2 family transcriptional regulator [Phycisphaerales bacterium]|nr:MAG: Rrf2 family transcriptional regulator [Phycisphaerales bacterium]
MRISKATAYGLHALMFMVRHITQLPVTTETMAKGEGIPPGYLAKIFQRLVGAGFVRAVRGSDRGYVFARRPEEISLLELFEAMEGGPLFSECFLKHCDCGGTTENCRIYAEWVRATDEVNRLLADTSVAAAAWNHPDHRFYGLSESLKSAKKKPKRGATRQSTTYQ